jgi:hypothetical protein
VLTQRLTKLFHIVGRPGVPISNELPSSWWSPKIGLHLLLRAHITWTSSNDRVQHNISTTETKVAVSLHLHHAPQAVMLECRLEILSNYSSSENLAHLNMQPTNGDQCNDVLANDTYLVGFVKELTTWYLAGGSLGLICIKPILSYNSFSKLSFKFLFFKGRNNPQILHSCKLCSTGRNLTKLEQ